MKTLKIMMRVILLISIVLTFATSTKAQLSVGLRGGVNFAHINYNDPVLKYRPKTAPGFALLLNYAITPSLNIQLEPGIAQWSAQMYNKQTTPGYISELTYRIYMNYIEVPVLIQYKPHFGKLQAIFSFGPEARFLAKPLKAKTKRIGYFGGLIIDQFDKVDVYKGDMGINKFDIGLMAGAGIAYPLGPLHLFAEGRYHYGLTNIYGHMNNDNYKTYVRGISAHTGVLIPVGKNKSK